jgi:hypothetical protein
MLPKTPRNCCGCRTTHGPHTPIAPTGVRPQPCHSLWHDHPPSREHHGPRHGRLGRESVSGARPRARDFSAIDEGARKSFPGLWTAWPGSQLSPHRQLQHEDSSENAHRWSNLGLGAGVCWQGVRASPADVLCPWNRVEVPLPEPPGGLAATGLQGADPMGDGSLGLVAHGDIPGRGRARPLSRAGPKKPRSSTPGGGGVAARQTGQPVADRSVGTRHRARPRGGGQADRPPRPMP